MESISKNISSEEEEFKMKLKTLKDLKKWKAKHGVRDGQPYVFYTQLRKEAIKWVKKPSVLEPPEAAKWRASTWIINFFNLTEDDLK